MKDWHFFSMLAMLFWGLWVILPKYAMNYVDSKTDYIYQTIGGMIIAFLFTVDMKMQIAWNLKGLIYGLLAGIAGGLGTYFFLKAMSIGKPSIVIPVTALYPIVGVVLSILLFNEILSIKQIIGIIFAVVSVVLLSS